MTDAIRRQRCFDDYQKALLLPKRGAVIRFYKMAVGFSGHILLDNDLPSITT
ncbi:MAG: hypothetical protein ACXV8O_02975 [Methylobacter sp.]